MSEPTGPGPSELLPCPFCGKSAARLAHSEDADGCYWAKVRCDNCGAETRGKWANSRADTCPIFYGEVRGEWNSRATANLHAAGRRVIAAFNAIGMHPSPTPPPALRFEAEAAMVVLDKAIRQMELA